MPLSRRWQRPFYVRKVESVKDSMGAVTSQYGNVVEHMGNIQPVTDTTILEAYGAVEKRLYAAYMDNADGIQKRDGVCYGIDPSESPNFEVVDILPWSRHTLLYIKGVS